ADEDDADERGEREDTLVGPLAEAGDGDGAPLAHGDEDVSADEQRQPEDHDCKAHGRLLSTSAHGKNGRAGSCVSRETIPIVGNARRAGGLNDGPDITPELA